MLKPYIQTQYINSSTHVLQGYRRYNPFWFIYLGIIILCTKLYYSVSHQNPTFLVSKLLLNLSPSWPSVWPWTSCSCMSWTPWTWWATAPWPRPWEHSNFYWKLSQPTSLHSPTCHGHASINRWSTRAWSCPTWCWRWSSGTILSKLGLMAMINSFNSWTWLYWQYLASA